jgi:GPH family glycoside/pentoside/hexuronide:cation symporter
MMKLGSGVAGAVMLIVLNIYGYNSSVVTKSAESLRGIVLNMSLIPAVFIFIAVILMLLYGLGGKQMVKIEGFLEKRRMEG